MIVPRSVNTTLQCFRAWTFQHAVQTPEMKKPKAYLDQLDYIDEIDDTEPHHGRHGYPASSGEASAAASATTITGEASLA